MKEFKRIPRKRKKEFNKWRENSLISFSMYPTKSHSAKKRLSAMFNYYKSRKKRGELLFIVGNR